MVSGPGITQPDPPKPESGLGSGSRMSLLGLGTGLMLKPDAAQNILGLRGNDQNNSWRPSVASEAHLETLYVKPRNSTKSNDFLIVSIYSAS